MNARVSGRPAALKVSALRIVASLAIALVVWRLGSRLAAAVVVVSTVGAALYAWYQIAGNSRTVDTRQDAMEGAYLGPQFSPDEVAAYLARKGYPYSTFTESIKRAHRIAELLAEDNVVGLFHGRMEFGPRALGKRSILRHARSPEMQSVMNLKVKYRESFRPFAPSVLEDRAHEYFALDVPSPYMLLVSPVRDEVRTAGADGGFDDIHEEVNKVRSTIPAVTHVDYSARIQTVSRETNPFY